MLSRKAKDGPDYFCVLDRSGYAMGALLTVTVQAITSAVQRRHDRITGAFDIRLESYVKTRRTIFDWSIAYWAARQLQSELRALINKIKIEYISLHSLDATGVQSDQAATASQQKIRQHVQELENKVFVLAHHMQNLYAAERELKEVSHTVALVAGKLIAEALAGVLGGIVGNTKPNELDFGKFDQAARRELGMKP
jgi:hypothetical protein